MSPAEPNPAEFNRANTVGTVEDLRASASRRTGLADFGPDDYTDGLAVLLDSLAADAGLTPLGAKAQRALLRGVLTARLCSEAAWQANPEYAEVGIDRPVFITGLPRTGTTALHRLLTADPANQGLEMWLTQVPQPRPPRDTWADDPAFQFLQAGLQLAQGLVRDHIRFAFGCHRSVHPVCSGLRSKPDSNRSLSERSPTSLRSGRGSFLISVGAAMICSARANSGCW